jgi:hypothetical protein
MAAPAFHDSRRSERYQIWPFRPHGKSRSDSSMFIPPNTAQTHRELNAFLRGEFVRRILPSDAGKQTTKRADQ